jgi:hypothetical protein
MLNIVICIIGISMGLFIGVLLIYIGKFKEYMDLKKTNGNLMIKLLDLLWRVSLPILFALISFLLPIQILCFLFNDPILIKSLSKIYSYSFVPSFFVCMFLLIRMGKIKTTKNLQ